MTPLIPQTGQQPSEDAQARFLRLFLASERELYRYVSAFIPNMTDAQEILQQTAMALWSKFDQYDPACPFTPWACRFALNVVRQWAARRQKWKSLLEDDLTDQLADRRAELHSQFESRLEHLESCMGKLPNNQRNIVEAYYFRRQDVESIATENRRTVDAIYKLLQRIRAALRLCIEQTINAGAELP